MKKRKLATVFAFFIALVFSFNSRIFSQAELLKGEIVGSGIHMRTDARITAPSLGKLKEGTIITILQEKYEWYKIILPKGFSCWAMTQYLKPLSDNFVSVDATNLNLRLGPSLDAAIIGIAKKDSTLVLAAKRNKWSKLDCHPYARAWVHKKFVKLIEKPYAEENSSISDRTDDIEIEKEDQTQPWNEFAFIGTLEYLQPLEDCEANFKLKTHFTTLFLKIDDTHDTAAFMHKDVTVKGTRLYKGCSYIAVSGIELQ